MVVEHLILVVTVLCLLWYRLSRKPACFPPGPYRWPILGNMLEFGGARKSYEVATDLQRRFGNLVGFYLAERPVVLVSGHDEIREMLARPECQGRPAGAVREYIKDIHGILFNQGADWREQRRFALRHFRDLGVGKQQMEALIVEEVHDMLQEASSLAGPDHSNPVSVMRLSSATGANVIFHLLAGRRFKRGSHELDRLIDLVKMTTTVNDAAGGVANAFPWLLRIAPWLTEFPVMMKYKMALKNFIKEMIAEHDREFCADNLKDFTDFFLAEMKKDDRDPSFHISQLVTVAYDLFVAGADTTVGLVSYALLNLVLNQDVQRRAQTELDAVVGRDRLPTLADRPNLPYCNAVISESLRIANVVVLSVPHAATEDFVFRTHFIPKGCRVIMNLYGLQMDPDLWEKPQEFRPERFLDAQGRLVHHDALMPFGVGKRACIGESLARTNIFLTLTALLQKYSMRVPDGREQPPLKQIGGIVLTPQSFDIKLTPRD